MREHGSGALRKAVDQLEEMMLMGDKKKIKENKERKGEKGKRGKEKGEEVGKGKKRKRKRAQYSCK